MYETAADLAQLQALLDTSFHGAGSHLRGMFPPEDRPVAADLPAELAGVSLLHLATVTAAGLPRVAPVDAVLHRGRFYFGSRAESARFRHLRSRPQVSGSVTRGWEFAALVHGVAVQVDLNTTEQRPVVQSLLEAYGPPWRQWSAEVVYWRLDPTAMFAYRHPLPTDNAYDPYDD